MGIFDFFKKASNKWNKEELMALYFSLWFMGHMDENLDQDEKDVILTLISSMEGNKYTSGPQNWSSFINAAKRIPLKDHLVIIKKMSEEKKLVVLGSLLTVANIDGTFDEKERQFFIEFKNLLQVDKGEKYKDVMNEFQDPNIGEENDDRKITNNKSTDKSKKRLTYLLPDEKKSGIYTEVDSISAILGFGDYFYSLSDWEQIKGIIEAFKKAGNDKMFVTWLHYEFRYMEYAFDDTFRIKFAKKISSYYGDKLTINELEEYFNNNVSWKA
jgi:hypothetical protein